METNKTIPIIPTAKLPKHIIALIKNPLKEISNMIAKYGDIFGLKLAKNHHIFFLNHPDYVRHILKDNQDNYLRGKAVKQAAITGLHEMLGNGIFMSDGEDWEAQHKLLKVLFSVTAINNTLPIIEEELSEIIGKWKIASKPQRAIPIEMDVNLLMLRIMLRTQVATNYHFDYEHIYQALTGRMESSSVRFLFIFQLKVGLLKPFGIHYKYKKHQQYLEILEAIATKLVNDLVEEKLEAVGLFQLLLQDYQLGKTTKKDIRDQFMNFVFAAFDTTATAITWTLYKLAANEPIQQKVSDELQNAQRETPNIPIANWQLPYLQMVVKETLRLYPPVWSYAREAQNADTIDGYDIPKKSIVVISSYAMHRHKDFWQNSEDFIPENFEKDQFKGKNFAYIPFGQGKRMCIGRALADYQMQIIIGGILQSFQLHTLSAVHPEINANIIIKGTKPIQLRLSERNVTV